MSKSVVAAPQRPGDISNKELTAEEKAQVEQMKQFQNRSGQAEQGDLSETQIKNDVKALFDNLETDDDVETDKPMRGEGIHVVVLHNAVSAADPNTLAHTQGKVVPISELIRSWKEGTEDEVRGEAERLFRLGAVRRATGPEAKAGFVDVTIEQQTQTAIDLRSDVLEKERTIEEQRDYIARLEAQLKGQGQENPGVFDPVPPGTEALNRQVEVPKHLTQ